MSRDPYDEYDNDSDAAGDSQWQYERYDPYGQEQPGQPDPYDPLEPEPQDPAYDPYAYPQEGYEQPYAPPRREPARPPHAGRGQRGPNLISTNAAINLTCTLCAGCGLFGLFLFFADQRSRAVRRFAVQSAGLLCAVVFLSAALALLATLFGYIPFIGGVISALLWAALAVLLCWDGYQRVRLMRHAYRGEACVLPVIGNYCRQFE